MNSKRYRPKKKYRSKKKLNIRRTSISEFGRQFGDEFGRVLVSGFRTTRTPVVKFNKRKRNEKDVKNKMKKFSSHTKKKYAEKIAEQFRKKNYYAHIKKQSGKYPYSVYIEKK